MCSQTCIIKYLLHTYMLDFLDHGVAYQLFENVNLKKKINFLELFEVLEIVLQIFLAQNIQTFQLL